MADIRESRSKDLSFGNPTVIPLMQTWDATEAFIYGEPSQTLATALGLLDAENQYEPFGYPIKVLMPYVMDVGITHNWAVLLNRWYGVGSANVEEKITKDDLLVILDITTESRQQDISHAERLISVAAKRSATILVVTTEGKRLPAGIVKQARSFIGSENSYWKIFTYHVVANVLYNQNPTNIYLFGEGLRTVASAIGAVDVLSRFDDSGSPIALTASRVKVDSETPLRDFGTNLTPEEVFTSFGIYVTDNAPADAGIEYSERQVLITPV